MSCTHETSTLRASRFARRVSLALLAVCLPVLTGCWPLAPIVAGIAAAGGGGGGGSGNNAAGVSLSGTIITDHNLAVASLGLDREPNDSLGFAMPIGSVTSAQPHRIEGTTGVRATLHALVAGGGVVDVLRQELLFDESSRNHVGDGGTRGAQPVLIARRGSEIFMVAGDAASGELELRVTPLLLPIVTRRIPLALPSGPSGMVVEPAGATICLDALLLLDASGDSSRLVAFDVDDGRPLVIADLQRTGLAQLAGSEELSSGRTRLFTCAPDRGELFEIEVTATGSDFRLGGVTSLGTPDGISDGIAALAYDGVLLHVVDGAGTLHSFAPDTLRTVATRPLLGRGERALALVAGLDLGFDGYQVEVPAGETLRVELATTSDSDGDGRFLLSAIERSSVAAAELAAPALLSRSTRAAQRLQLELAAPNDSPKSFDVVVGALAGAARYQLALGGRARAPSAGEPRTRGTAATELATSLETGVIAALSSDRLVQIYRDPLLPDFAPGRIVLGRADLAAALALPPAPRGLSLRRASRSPSGWDVVDVATTAEFTGPPARSLHGATTRRSLRREQARALLAALDGIAGAPGVAWSEPQYIAHSLALPNDPGFAASQQWHYDLINLQAAWDVTTGATSTILACVDTGIRTDNADLNANVGSDGYDFVSGTNDNDGVGGADTGIDPDPFDPGVYNPANPFANQQHGSHTAGTMGEQGNNATLGTGVCWDCTIMPVRALGTDGTGFTTDIADAIHYAARIANASGTLPATRAAVINLSLGLASSSAVIHTALINAVNAGCVVLCAAGNTHEPVLFPAAHPEAIAVAAADPNGNVATYSNLGPEIDITCPGGAGTTVSADDVFSTVVVSGNGVLRGLSGTSMAAPHAAGVAGLMITLNPGLDQDDVRSILTNSAVDIGAPGFDNDSGFGMVDAFAAVNGAPPVLDLSAASVDFGNTGTDLVVQARNSGGGSLNVSSSLPLTVTMTPVGGTPTTGWLTATLLADDKTIHLDADRSVLTTPGDYQVRVDVTSDGGNGSFLAGVTAGAGGVTDVGSVVVWVFDADGATFLAGTTAVAANNYAWSLPNLPASSVPRNYFLVTGVDLDGDDVIGEVGEPFGAYPNAANFQLLELETLNSLQIDLLLE